MNFAAKMAHGHGVAPALPEPAMLSTRKMPPSGVTTRYLWASTDAGVGTADLKCSLSPLYVAHD
jgi:hypothetical protein